MSGQRTRYVYGLWQGKTPTGVLRWANVYGMMVAQY